MSEHPPLFQLDAHAAGVHDAHVSGHVDSCIPCKAYVQSVTAQAQTWSTGANSAEFVLALSDKLGKADEHRERGVSRSHGVPPWVGWMAGPILAAAAVLVLVRSRGPEQEPKTATTTDEPSTRFKGKLQVAVVRDRMGDQSRIATEVRVRPGDRLRAELSLDDARPVEVGFLGKDGTWVLLFAPAFVEAGTHFSERSARFDDTPTEGWIIAGAPEDVSRAKVTRSFDAVSVIPVIAEP